MLLQELPERLQIGDLTRNPLTHLSLLSPKAVPSVLQALGLQCSSPDILLVSDKGVRPCWRPGEGPELPGMEEPCVTDRPDMGVAGEPEQAREKLPTDSFV